MKEFLLEIKHLAARRDVAIWKFPTGREMFPGE